MIYPNITNLCHVIILRDLYINIILCLKNSFFSKFFFNYFRWCNYINNKIKSQVLAQKVSFFSVCLVLVGFFHCRYSRQWWKVVLIDYFIPLHLFRLPNSYNFLFRRKRKIYIIFSPSFFLPFLIAYKAMRNKTSNYFLLIYYTLIV